ASETGHGEGREILGKERAGPDQPDVGSCGRSKLAGGLARMKSLSLSIGACDSRIHPVSGRLMSLTSTIVMANRISRIEPPSRPRLPISTKPSSAEVMMM